MLLSLGVETRSETGVVWSELRRLASGPPPELAGLAARWWRPERRGLRVRYLFNDAEALASAREALIADSANRLACSPGEISERTDVVSPAATVLDRPVFIVSAPRGGSTLLYDLLALGNGIRSLGQEMQDLIDGIPALNLALRDYRSQVLDERDADDDVASSLKACILAELVVVGRPMDSPPASLPDSIRFLDKTPENALRVPFLARLFPDARFIFLTRDLRPHVSSIIAAWRHGGFTAIPELPGFGPRPWCFLLPEGWRRVAEASLGEIAAFQWYAANQAIVEAFEALPEQRWTRVDYSDLLAKPGAVIEQLCAFMEIDPGERLLRALEQPIPLSATTITAPSPIKWKSNPDFDPRIVKPLQPLAGRMRSLGAKSTPPVARATRATSVRFACFVDQLESPAVATDARLDPTLQVQLGESLPLGLLPMVRNRERFLTDHPVIWRRDPATGVWRPLWLRRHQAWLAMALAQRGDPLKSLTGELRGQCYAAGILTTDAVLDERRHHGVELRAFGSMALERDRFCHLPGLIDPVLARALARYYYAMIDTGDWSLGDGQVEQRHGWHNERVCQFLHHQLAPFLSQVAGISLKPTYCFASAYRGGAVLDAHLDREQCDYTLSLLIDEDRPPEGAAWPLWFQAPDRQRSLILAVTDAVLFRGCELPHWRDPATRDHRQINLLFHFVPADWVGVMD